MMNVDEAVELVHEAEEKKRKEDERIYNLALDQAYEVFNEDAIDAAIRDACANRARYHAFCFHSNVKLSTVTEADSLNKDSFPAAETPLDKRIKKLWEGYVKNGFRVRWKTELNTYTLLISWEKTLW